MIKKTVFYEHHRRLGAKMREFAGFEMPIEYTGVRNEHINVRKKAGIFDVSHMGEIWVKGSAARDFTQRVTSNDVDKLEPGKVQYSCFVDHSGGIVDDLLVYRYSDEKYMLVVNASNIEKDWDWLVENNQEKADLENASSNISQLALQGPHAVKILAKLASEEVVKLPPFRFKTSEMAGQKDVIVSTTGYTGAGGYELYFHNDAGPALWDAILEAGKEHGLLPVGLAARDTLRLEMGYCLYGNDISHETTPLEAGLGWITKLTENNNFIGSEPLKIQKEDGVKRKLVGFELEDRGIPRQHYKAFSLHGEEIGEVTSGTMSPMMNKGIGMAILRRTFATEGSIFQVAVRNKMLRAKVVKLPIYKK